MAPHQHQTLNYKQKPTNPDSPHTGNIISLKVWVGTWQTFTLALHGISRNQKEVFELSPPGRVSLEGKENNYYKVEFGSKQEEIGREWGGGSGGERDIYGALEVLAKMEHRLSVFEGAMRAVPPRS